MKKFIIMMLMVLLIPAVAYCGQYSVTAQWGYDNPPTDLEGFRIANGEMSFVDVPISESFISMDGEEAKYSWTGVMEMSDGPNLFTLTAYDMAGQMGPVSDPSGYDPPPAGQAKTILLLFSPM